MIDAAAVVSDLEAPPGNQLEKLTGDLEGFWSIRVNDRWRVTFVWDGDEPEQVAVVDYH
jgi:proteic killer suppression protein